MCLFSLHLTPLTLFHGTGASGTFRFKKQGQTCKVKKIGANVQLQVKIRAVLQLTLVGKKLSPLSSTWKRILDFHERFHKRMAMEKGDVSMCGEI